MCGADAARRIRKAAALLAVLLLLFSAAPAGAETPCDAFLRSRPLEQPGFYWLWGRGNCVWFAWVCAWERYGVRLPWAGDARNWLSLAGREVFSVDGAVYRLELSDRPEPDSIMVVLPRPDDSLPYAYLGHVAWMVNYIPDDPEDEARGGPIVLLESTVYSPDGWGC
ncbi:MAG: CHAP domain-containing protein [Thermacetogeniaceae bacterium]